MNRRSFLHTATYAVAGASTAPFLFGEAHAAPGKIGKLDPAEFKRINKQAGAKVTAIAPTVDPLSEADHKLMMQVAAGGMMQLELSRLAAKKSANPDVKTIAAAEVEEQMTLSKKLKEVAAAKKVSLPATPDGKTAKLRSKLEGLEGAEFDRAYLQESGINGHQLLQATMKKVQAKAQDATLKSIASTALPLIDTHLQESRDEAASMA